MCSPKPTEIVGYGFRPTDEELVDFYLKHKLLGDDPRVHVLTHIDLCDVEPWEVPALLAKSEVQFKDPEWFFFSPVDFKYSNSKRVNRRTKCGFWKPTGKDRDVRTWDTNTVIGTKKTLVFHNGSASKGVKANWVIHEYHALNFHQSQAFVLCRLIKKPGKITEGKTDAVICDEVESSINLVSDYENQTRTERVPSGGMFTGVETICEATDQTDKGISPIEASIIDVEQYETSSLNSSSINAYFKNENNNTKISFKSMQNAYDNIQILNENNQISSPNLKTSLRNFHTPSESTWIPYEMTDISQIPFKSIQNSYEISQISYEILQTLLKSIGNSNEISQIPFDNTQISHEKFQTSCENNQIPFQITQNPCEITHTSFEVTQIPNEDSQAPFKIIETPFENNSITFKTTQIPYKNSQITSETVQHSFETTQTPFETIPKEELPNSHESLTIDEENMFGFLNCFTQSESLKRAYYESTCTDEEVVPNQDANIEDIPTMSTEYLISDKYHSLKWFKTSYDIGHGDTCLLSSNQEPNQESIWQDDFWGSGDIML
ncbi:NAC domain-containing protein 35-like isoform X2 [Vigna unguiculata]|uniref:NAC domain-containing protein 35-like isoform X2 n=1 Tax=Vigna unguiculata TaxID=3917 RepID=UPI00101624DE|nr:NAC domain-containing protein 35-like isoform X2 [Vigna unguiculata]